MNSERLTHRRDGLLQRTRQLLEQGQDILDLSAPPLEIFFWHRLVVDELHEPLRALRDAAGLGTSSRTLSGDAKILPPSSIAKAACRLSSSEFLRDLTAKVPQPGGSGGLQSLGAHGHTS